MIIGLLDTGDSEFSYGHKKFFSTENVLIFFDLLFYRNFNGLPQFQRWRLRTSPSQVEGQMQQNLGLPWM